MRKLVFAAIAAALLALPLSASANGPCGQNSDGNTACGVNSPSSQSGSLTTDNESDYYVFHAQQNTELHATITDTDNPSCSAGYSSCGGDVQVELTDAQGNEIEYSDYSEPNNGITVPESINTTLPAKGNYYLIVQGELDYDSTSGTNSLPVPYRLDVTASPNVVWPAPAPYTVQQCTTKYRYKYKYVWKIARRGRRHRRVRVRVRVRVKVKYASCRTVTIYP